MVFTIIRCRVIALLVILMSIIFIVTGSLQHADLFGIYLLTAGIFLLVFGVLFLIKPFCTPRNMLGLLLVMFAFLMAAATTGIYKNNQTVRAWGSNENYQLGIGERYSAAFAPRTVMNPVPFHMVIAAGDLSYAIDKDKMVWAWGSNEWGALGNGTYYDSTVPVKVINLKGIVQVAGNDFGIALTRKHEVWTWGQNNFGQLGNGTYENSPVPAKVEGLSNIIAIEAKGRYCMALDSSGVVWTWGANYSGQLGDGTRINRNRPIPVTGLPEVKAISAGTSSSYALDNKGRVWAWGDNYYGALGNGTNVNSYVPVLSLVKDIKSITAGNGMCYAMDKDNTILGWGFNADGRLGDGTTISKNYPVKMDTLQNITQIATGSSHNLALDKKGRVWVWGINYLGSLGNGQDGRIAYITPTLLHDVSNVNSLSAGVNNLVIEELPALPMLAAIVTAVILFIVGVLLWFINKKGK